MKLKEIAEKIGGKVVGDGNKEVNWVGSFENGQPDQISFITNEKYLEKARKSKAGAFVVAKEEWTGGKPGILVPEPYRAFVAIENLFLSQEKPKWGIHKTAVLGERVNLGSPVYIGPYVVIEDGAEIGDRARIDAHCFIGKNCKVGPDTHFHPRVTLLERCTVGARCILNSGCVIGGDGFGFIPGKDGHTKIPQLGMVEIQDDVELGAQCMIDRASLDKTVIGQGTKFDNCVHIAHSCVLGKNVIILAGTIFGGSVLVGDNVTLSGNCVVRDHVKIAPGTNAAGGSGIAWDITEPNKIYFGFPAFEFDKVRPFYFHIPEFATLLERVKKLEEKQQGQE
jgi:UDP-3-O-[3-hydroxymyristoyl] glucosamine N-acyltransferase